MHQASIEKARILVVGGASQDTLRFEGSADSVRVFGGAGLYTALAAERAGARVTMIGPRPKPMPTELASVPDRLEWVGRPVSPEELPQFEILYPRSGSARLLAAEWRAEAELGLADLPDPLNARLAHCIPFSDPDLQLRFVRALEARGCRTAAGTFPRAVEDRPGTVGEIFAAADVFFCNEFEADVLFGGVEAARTEPGRLLFVTRGPRGARVIQGDHATDLRAVETEVVDPTGAGDVFAGTVLAWLGRGAHPVLAASAGVAAASESIRGRGPAALLAGGRAPAVPTDSRVKIDPERIRAVASRLATAEEVVAFDFEGEAFPAQGEPGALDYFFASTVLQFGFWLTEGGRYASPMTAEIEGRSLKGTDVLFALFKRWMVSAPEALQPRALSDIRPDQLEARLAADDGRCPFPQMEDRVRLLRSYGRDMEALGWSAELVLKHSNEAAEPLSAFMVQLDQVAGFKEDPLRKKSALLAAIMRQRPERFLDGRDELPPIVDYHVQRSCLRMGLVRVGDPDLESRLRRRRLLGPEDHDAIRAACYRAVEELVRASGLTMGAVDYFLFQNRRRCPEMAEPECSRCPVDPSCRHEKDLFQPVRRVTFY